MTVSKRAYFDRRIRDLMAEPHSGARIALRAGIGIEFIQEWLAGRLLTDEDVADMMKRARKEGYEEAISSRYGQAP